MSAQAERIRADATAMRAELDVTLQDRGRARDELAVLRPQRAEALHRMQQETNAAQEARQERDAAQRRADERDRTAREQAVLTQRAQDIVAEQREELHARGERLSSLEDRAGELEARLCRERSAGDELAAALDATRRQLQITRANLAARSRQAESLAEDLGQLRDRRSVRLLRKLGLV